MIQTPVISVIMITYQHVDFIRQGIQAIMDQDLDEPYELLLGEDQSTDGTREICQEMAEKYPDKIRLFLRDRTEQISIMGAPSGRGNFIGSFKEVKGDFIALCPGDDLWTDTSKLRKQIELMKSDPDVSVCFCNAEDVYMDGSRSDYVRSWLKTNSPKSEYHVEDIVTNNFIPSSGCMFRKDTFNGVPDEFYSVPSLDWYLHVSGAMRGKISFIDEIMTIRRKHKGGMISMKRRLPKIYWTLETLSVLDKLTEWNYHSQIQNRMIELFKMAMDYAMTHDPKAIKEIQSKMDALDVPYSSARERIKAFVILYMPWLSRFILRLRSA